MAALHKLIPFGVAGFVINLTTGIMFFTTAPDQYAYNPAFQLKMLFMLCAGVNMLLFYRTSLAAVKASFPEQRGPYPAMFIAIVSLSCWSVVIVSGRLITYFRPPYHWCFWCQ